MLWLGWGDFFFFCQGGFSCLTLGVSSGQPWPTLPQGQCASGAEAARKAEAEAEAARRAEAVRKAAAEAEAARKAEAEAEAARARKAVSWEGESRAVK